MTRLRDGATRRGRPRFVWTAAPEPSSEQRSYQVLAAILAEYLSGPGAAEEAGVRFGARWVARGPAGGVTLDRVIRMLDDIGFRLEVTPDGSAIRLHHCPFHELARGLQEVVCRVHLGLIRGALQQLGAPAEAIRLVPIVTPRLCLVELGPPVRAPDRPAVPAPGPAASGSSAPRAPDGA